MHAFPPSRPTPSNTPFLVLPSIPLSLSPLSLSFKILELVAEELAPKVVYAELVEKARDDQVCVCFVFGLLRWGLS